MWCKVTCSDSKRTHGLPRVEGGGEDAEGGVIKGSRKLGGDRYVRCLHQGGGFRVCVDGRAYTGVLT